MQLTSNYRRVAQIRPPDRGVLVLNLRKDGRRASLTLDGLVLEVGIPRRIQGRYRTLSQPGGQ